MRKFIIHLKKLDWYLIFLSLSISSIGLLSIYSSSPRTDFFNFEKQIVFLVIGFILMLAISFFDWRSLKNDPFLIIFLYLIFFIFLLGLFFFAPSIRGVKSWYKIGPFSFEPIVFMELIIVILLAKYFSLRHIELYRVKHIIISGIYVLIPSLLVFFQPDLGSAIIILGVWIFTLFISGIRLRHFLILTLIFVLIFSLGWMFFLKDYQKERITSFIRPHLNVRTSGWSQNQSKIAIGSGGLFGKGIRKGTQTQYGFLPEPQTDFIFAAIAEETGFLGVFVLFILFILLFLHLFKIAFIRQSNFVRLFTLGFAFLIAIQAFINIGMNLGILPIIGIPLPFVSYGGSSLVTLFIGLGILQSIRTH